MPYDQSSGKHGKRRLRGTRTTPQNSYKLPRSGNFGNPANSVSKYDSPLGGILSGAADMVTAAAAKASRPSPLLPDVITNKDDFTNAVAKQMSGRAAVRKASAATSKTPVAKQKQDDLSALLGELTGSLTGIQQNYDYEGALQQGANAIKKAYGAEIGAVRHAGDRARRDTAKGNKEIRRMYNQLAKSFVRSGKSEAKQGTALANQITALATDAGNTVKGNSDKILAEQAQLAKNLGVEAALPDVQDNQRANTDAQMARITNTGARDSETQLKMSGNQRRYMNRGAQGARFEGTNRRADMIAALQDYLQQNQDKIAGLKGNQAKELAANRSETMKTAADVTAKNNEDMWNHLQDIANLKLKIEDTRADNKRADAQTQYNLHKPYSTSSSKSSSPFPKNMQNFADIMGMTSQPRRNTGIMNQILSSEDFAQGRFHAPNGEVLKMTPTQAANEAEKAARKAGVKEKDIPKIRLAAMAYVQGQ